MLLDSGSTLSYISKTASKKFNPDKIKKDKVVIILLDKSQIIVNEYLMLEVTHEHLKFDHKFYIYEKIFNDGLIGLDLIRIVGLKIAPNFEITSGDSKRNVQITINLYKNHVIKAHSTAEIKFPKMTIFRNSQYKPHPQIFRKYELFSPIQRLETNKSFKIYLINHKNVDIFLHKGTNIGILTEDKETLMVQTMWAMNKPEDSTSEALTNEEENEIMSKIQIITDIPGLRDLIKEFAYLFTFDISKLKRARDEMFLIDTGDHRPVATSYYRTSLKNRSIIQEEVENMLKHGIIKPSNSPWAAGVTLVPKPDGSIRFCVDYRPLNKVTTDMSNPLPHIGDIHDGLQGSEFFTSLDLRSGYWAITLDPRTREKSAFTCHLGLFEFQVMPFGLKNAPSKFQQILQELFREDYKFTKIYLDDIIIHSRTPEEHLLHLRVVFEKIKYKNLRFNIKKCHIATKEIMYLGYIVNGKDIRAHPEKVRPIEDIPPPKNLKALQRFLGLANYYRRFILGFSKIARPLNKNCGKEQNFKWTDECQRAFEQLKYSLTHQPVVSHFIPECETKLYCDASNVAIGSVLCQIQEDKERVIHYYSKTLDKHQINYATSEKEVYAVVQSIQYFRHYLHGIKFTVVTDNTCTCQMHRIKDKHSRIARWSMLLSTYNFEIKFRSGKQHMNCDALSRFPIDKPGEEFEDMYLLWAPISDEIDLPKEQKEDPEILEILKLLENPKSKWHSLYNTDEDGVLYRRTINDLGHPIDLIYLPKTLRKTAFDELHKTQLSGHPAVLRMKTELAKRFYWKRQLSDIERWCKACPECQYYKDDHTAPKGKMLLRTLPDEPWHTLSIDIAGPLYRTRRGNQYIIIAICHYTKYMVATATKNHKSLTVANFFIDEIIVKYGFPVKVLTDRGQNFVSNFIEEFWKINEIQHLCTIAWRPQSNGLVERSIRTLKTAMRCYSDLEDHWDILLNRLVFSYNKSVHNTTGESPHRMLFKTEPRLAIDLGYKVPHNNRFNQKYANSMELAQAVIKLKIQRNREVQKMNYDSNRIDKEFMSGTLVLLRIKGRTLERTTMFTPLFKGPYLIVRKLSPVAYELQNIEFPNKKLKRAHIADMKRYYSAYPGPDDEEETENCQMKNAIKEITNDSSSKTKDENRTGDDEKRSKSDVNDSAKVTVHSDDQSVPQRGKTEHSRDSSRTLEEDND